MPLRRSFLVLMFASAVAHVWAASQVNMPSQDGLKFIRIAQDFCRQPAWDVVRSADQHPLYPALVAFSHVIVGSFGPNDSSGWRVAAQLVSVVAGLLTLWPLYAIAIRLFRPSTAIFAVFLWLLLPMTFILGHETLSDATSLCLTAWSMLACLKAVEADAASRRAVYACLAGLFVAEAYWTRPEGLLAAASIGLTLALRGGRTAAERAAGVGAFASVVAISVGAYLTINGTLSDRLAAFQGSSQGSPSRGSVVTSLPKGLPAALRDPRLDFSPKDPAEERSRPGLKAAAWSILRLWSESLGIGLAVMTLWGLARTCTHDAAARSLVTAHAALLLGALTLQAAMRGYLSGRHVVGLTFLSVPFAAAALRLSALRLAGLFRLNMKSRRIGTGMALTAMALIGIALHSKPLHASRQPHFEAGRWLAENTHADAAVFDTRGWAAFEAGRRRYDPYHLAQAISDTNTKFWVLEAGELESGSRRALTLAMMLADGGRLEARFRRKNGRDQAADVLVFAWSRPHWWDDPARSIPAWPDSEEPAMIDTNVSRAVHEPKESESR